MSLKKNLFHNKCCKDSIQHQEPMFEESRFSLLTQVVSQKQSFTALLSLVHNREEEKQVKKMKIQPIF